MNAADWLIILQKLMFDSICSSVLKQSCKGYNSLQLLSETKIKSLAENWVWIPKIETINLVSIFKRRYHFLKSTKSKITYIPRCHMSGNFYNLFSETIHCTCFQKLLDRTFIRTLVWISEYFHWCHISQLFDICL